MIVVAIAAGLIGYVIGKPAPPQVQAKAPDTSEKSTEPKEPAFVKEGLVAYYPFNGNARDESGNGNDGKVNEARLDTDRHGKVSSSYNFDGVNDRIDIGTKHYPSGSEDRAVSLWLKLPAQQKAPMAVLWAAGKATPGRAVALAVHQQKGGKIFFGMDPHGGPYLPLIATSFDDNKCTIIVS